MVKKKRGVGIVGGRTAPASKGSVYSGEADDRRSSPAIHGEEALRDAVRRYEQQVRLFHGVTSTILDFVYVFDLQGRFIYANRRLLEAWGMQLPEVIGRTCRELGYEQWHHDLHMREIAQVIQTKQPVKGEVPFKAPLTGIFGIYEYIFTPVLGADGRVEVVAGTTRDITERRRAEEKLERTRSMLMDGERIAHLGTWHWIAETQETVWSEEEFRIYGLAPGRTHPATRT